MVKSDLHGLFAWVMSCYAWVSIEIITMLFFYGNTLFIFPSLIFLVSYSRWSEIKDIGFGKRNNIYCMRNAPLYCCLPLSCLRYSFHLSVLPTSGGVCPFLCSLQCWGSCDKVWWWVMSWRPGVRKRKLMQENLWINCMVWMSINPKPQFETKIS